MGSTIQHCVLPLGRRDDTAPNTQTRSTAIRTRSAADVGFARRVAGVFAASMLMPAAMGLVMLPTMISATAQQPGVADAVAKMRARGNAANRPNGRSVTFAGFQPVPTGFLGPVGPVGPIYNPYAPSYYYPGGVVYPGTPQIPGAYGYGGYGYGGYGGYGGVGYVPIYRYRVRSGGGGSAAPRNDGRAPTPGSHYFGSPHASQAFPRR